MSTELQRLSLISSMSRIKGLCESFEKLDKNSKEFKAWSDSIIQQIKRISKESIEENMNVR